MNKILKKLGIKSENPGAWSPASGWSKSKDGPVLESRNPANGELIATVHGATAADYDRVISESQAAYDTWRTISPRFGAGILRQVGDALREKKDALGSLVTMEMGKIKAEGDGEVQE